MTDYMPTGSAIILPIFRMLGIELSGSFRTNFDQEEMLDDEEAAQSSVSESKSARLVIRKQRENFLAAPSASLKHANFDSESLRPVCDLSTSISLCKRQEIRLLRQIEELEKILQKRRDISKQLDSLLDKKSITIDQSIDFQDENSLRQIKKRYENVLKHFTSISSNEKVISPIETGDHHQNKTRSKKVSSCLEEENCENITEDLIKLCKSIKLCCDDFGQ